MPIKYIKEKRVFHLYNKDISYKTIKGKNGLYFALEFSYDDCTGCSTGCDSTSFFASTLVVSFLLIS